MVMVDIKHILLRALTRRVVNGGAVHLQQRLMRVLNKVQVPNGL
jgi:hypothetical protein